MGDGQVRYKIGENERKEKGQGSEKRAIEVRKEDRGVRKQKKREWEKDK